MELGDELPQENVLKIPFIAWLNGLTAQLTSVLQHVQQLLHLLATQQPNCVSLFALTHILLTTQQEHVFKLVPVTFKSKDILAITKQEFASSLAQHRITAWLMPILRPITDFAYFCALRPLIELLEIPLPQDALLSVQLILISMAKQQILHVLHHVQ